MVTKSQNEGSKSGKGTDPEQANKDIEAATATIVQKVLGEELLSEIDTSMHDVFVDIHADSTPVQEISVSFEQAFHSYAQMSEKDFLAEVKKALASADDKGNNFLNLEFEDLFAVPLTEGGSDAGRSISSGSEGSVTSLERLLSRGNIFEREDVNELFKVQSQPQMLSFDTGFAYPYSVAPTPTTNLTSEGPRAPPIFIRSQGQGEQLALSETLLNTQANVIIQSNIFTPSIFNNNSAASVGSGLLGMDVFFNVPARAGSSEDRTSVQNVTTLTTPEGNVFEFNRSNGDYSYTLNNAVLHLQSVWGAGYVNAAQEIFTDKFVYAITGTNLQTAVGNITVYIGDDRPVAIDFAPMAITEAEIQTKGSNGSGSPEVLSGTLINGTTSIFGADGGTVTNVTLVGGSTGISSGTITVTDVAGNTLVINRATGSYAYNLNNPFNNTVTEPTLLVYTFTFTDADLDTVSKTLTITINDDVPIATDIVNAVAVNEADIPVIGSSPDVTAPTISGTLLNGSGNVFGADGGSVSAVTIIGNTSNVVTVTTITVTTAEGNVLVVTRATGAYTYTLNAPIDNDSDANSSTTQGTDIFNYTFTDNDGDIESADLTVTIDDDAPTGTLTLNAGAFVTTDETPGVQSPESLATGFLGQTTVSYATFITDTTIYGSDGAGTRVFSLLATDGADSGFNNSAGTQNIYLFNNGSIIEGRETNSFGAVVFTVSVNASTGDVTLTQYLAVQHVNTLNPNDSSVMSSNVLSLVATVTDADGDVVTPSVDLGSVIKFYDDGATAENQTPSGNEDAASILINISATSSDGIANFRIDILPNPTNGILYTDSTLNNPLIASALIAASANSATLYFVPTLNFNGNVLVDYIGIDNDGDSDAAQVNITVTPVNDAPVANDQNVSVFEDGAPTPATLVNADDVDSDDDQASLTYNIISPLLAGEGSVVVNPGGTFTYSPGGDFQGLALGEKATVDFTYKATDAQGADSGIQTVSVEVTGINDAPISQDLSIHTYEDGGPVLGSMIADDIDSDDDPTSLNYTILTVLSGLQSIVNSGAAFTYDPSTDFQYLAEDETQTFFIDYKATDSHYADSNIATIKVIVHGVNDLPTANPDAYDDGLSIIRTNLNGLLFNDSDPDTTDTLLVFEISYDGNPGVVGSPMLLENGVVTVGKDGSLSYSGNGNGMPDFFSYTISDGNGVSFKADVSLNAGVPPMILDLNNNNKIDLIDPDKSLVTLNSFDDTTGTNQMGWVQPGDGILVYDYQGDGKVTNIDEIALTLHSEQAKTDLDALRIAFDTNHDGVFDAKDAEFSKFGVWQDKNSDGISDSGEYQTLTQMGIISFNVNSDHQAQIIAGNTVHGFSSYQTVDGASHLMADVSLSVAPATKSVAINSPDVIGEHASINFASLPPLASDNNHTVSLSAVSTSAVEAAHEAVVTSSDVITQQLQQHQETPLS